jgi:hypothetical protein
MKEALTADPSMGWLTYVIQGGALALLAVVLFAFFWRVLPSFLQALKEQQSEFLSHLRERDSAHQAVINAIASEHKEAVARMADALDKHSTELARVHALSKGAT